MDLNILKNIKEDIKNNIDVKGFIQELTNFLKNVEQSKTKEDLSEINIDEELQYYRKEGHLYLVTEDRMNEIYLSDFTEKSKIEFKEKITDKELLNIAKEGAMLQYKNGKYELYSQNGYDMLFEEEKN
ncbi:MAG: hypothetical protein HFJ41_00905 [Clostridia bacterium]|nr:hypothetical protein [Clostridia bacterium]